MKSQANTADRIFMNKEIKMDTKNLTKINIFAYDNYRIFLKDYYEFRKSSKHGFSYRQFSMECGFKSPNIMKLIIDGKRNLRDQTLTQVAKCLKLTKDSKKYFQNLIKFNQAKTDVEKSNYWENLKELSHNQNIAFSELTDYEYLSKWYHPVIRELVNSPDYASDPYWIFNKLGGTVNISDITLSLQLLAKSEDVKSKNFLKSSDEISSLVIRNYHQQMLERAKASLQSCPLEYREFGSQTMSVDIEEMKHVKKLIKEFRQSIMEWLNREDRTTDSSHVVQLNLQMFPHTKVNKK